MKPAELVDVDRGRVHMHAYTNAEVFHQEMRRIYYRTWIYVAHESEIAFPGDYKTTRLGQVPIIVTRDEDGGINVMVNRCAHRGTTVCQRDTGNANYFKCEYHGWVYDNKGALTGVSLRKGYDENELEHSTIGLQPLPRVDSYQGLIFASVNPDVEPLEEFLGLAKPYIDAWANQSPDGEIAIQGGRWQFEYRGNWKLQAENNTEGYHPDFLHQAAVQVQIYNSNRSRAAAGKEARKKTPRIAALNARGIDLGNGHNLVETPQVSILAKRRYPADYIEALIDKHGEDGLDQVLVPWRLTIFPNLSLGGGNLRVIQPVAPDHTLVRQYYVDLPTAPEGVRAFRHDQEQGFYGQAGFGGPDDVEMFERMQEGFNSGAAEILDPWLLFNRQVTNEVPGPNGELIADSTSEITQRAVYRGWHAYMASGE